MSFEIIKLDGLRYRTDVVQSLLLDPGTMCRSPGGNCWRRTDEHADLSKLWEFIPEQVYTDSKAESHSL